MPYIKREERAQYQELLNELSKKIPADRMARPGHLNYVISLLLDKVYGKNLRYADHNEALGVLAGVSQEFYRRKTAPYEDIKIREEGDLDEL
ncbi:MAG: hypothetical protein U0136_17340 [Bdellovibrionota bacterium]